MGWRGRGYKTTIIKAWVRFIKNNFSPGILYDAPKTIVPVTRWLKQTSKRGSITGVFDSEQRTESPPEIFNHPVTRRFTKYYKRNTPAAFVAEILNGAVVGKYTNAVLLAPGVLAEDLSRQFGAYGGVPAAESNLVQTDLKLPSPEYIKGRVAVITTSGADNFHHWLYDCLPRIYLLKKAGKLESINYFLISYKGLPFQVESLKLIGIDPARIINPQQNGKVHFQMEEMIVPSLPAALGTVSPWVVIFLQELFNPAVKKNSGFNRIYVSRRKAVTRKVINNDELLSLLGKFNITEVFPEEYSIAEFAAIMANATCIVSIHGSGLSNLCFAPENAVVIDILAPWHQDGYYWLISNIRKARYIGFFAEGNHPADEIDLVRHKQDDDMLVDISAMNALLTRELKQEKNAV